MTDPWIGIPPNILRGRVKVIVSEEERNILSHQVVSCPLISDKTCRVYHNYEWNRRCVDCPLIHSSPTTAREKE